MEATRIWLSEEQAEKVAGLVKTLLLHPEQMLEAVDHPGAALQAAGLREEDISQIREYLGDVAANLEVEAFPWF